MQGSIFFLSLFFFKYHLEPVEMRYVNKGWVADHRESEG